VKVCVEIVELASHLAMWRGQMDRQKIHRLLSLFHNKDLSTGMLMAEYAKDPGIHCGWNHRLTHQEKVHLNGSGFGVIITLQ
jgi:hypothetical protein